MTTTDPLRSLAMQVTVADVVDAVGRLHGHRCHVLDLVTPTPGRVLFGPAVTISYFPTCHEARDPKQFNFARLFYQAARDDPSGKVLVLAANGHPDVSLAGSTKLSRVHNLGLAGVLADGRLRDFDQLAGYDFAAYCRGEATKWGGDVVAPFQANVPVVVSRVGIVPGDYVYAASSGAVVIPAAQVGEVLEGAARVAEQEAGHVEFIRNEDPHSPPWDER